MTLEERITRAEQAAESYVHNAERLSDLAVGEEATGEAKEARLSRKCARNHERSAAAWSATARVLRAERVAAEIERESRVTLGLEGGKV